jgi:Tol biopolymer transport system component
MGWVLGALLILALVGAGVVAWVRFAPPWFESGSSGRASSSPTSPASSCATARAGGDTRLGLVAWVRDGALRLADLDTCKERTLVQAGAAPPVRFSHDGRWVAFGQGSIVSARGGPAASPLGRVSEWRWSPTNDVLAGVTRAGGVVLGGPTRSSRTLVPDGSGAGSVAFSPNGRSLAVAVDEDRVQVLDVAGGAATTIYRVTPGTKAPPQVAGWSADGRWVLFFSRFANRAGVPLNAAPTVGGVWANVFDPLLPYDDFLSWCGKRLVLSGGAKQLPSEGNQILVTGPPSWQFHDLSADFSRSWIWPACSPDGRWIAATAMSNGPESPPGDGVRSLWLLSTDGKRRARLTDTTGAAYEVPRWSADGRFILIVSRGLEPSSPGVLVLLRIDPSSGKARRVPGAVAHLGPAPGTRGHTDWSDVSDWYRPDSPS